MGTYDDEVVPERCDGCGREAARCGMLDVGWTVRTAPAGFQGVYCPSCAEALHILPFVIRCTECGDQVADERVADRRGWRFLVDELGSLVPYCSSCVHEVAAST